MDPGSSSASPVSPPASPGLAESQKLKPKKKSLSQKLRKFTSRDKVKIKSKRKRWKERNLPKRKRKGWRTLVIIEMGGGKKKGWVKGDFFFSFQIINDLLW